MSDLLTAPTGRTAAVGEHPAQFTDSIIDALAEVIPAHVTRRRLVFDPFAGPGIKLGALCDRLRYRFAGNDLEIWEADRRVALADSTKKAAYPKGKAWVVVTSPCLAHGHRVLRDDLRWVPVEHVQVGDRLVAFDEMATELTARGHAARRKWQLAEVTYSEPQMAECVRVHLANGDEVVCTPNHPWLADRYATGGNSLFPRAQWVPASELLWTARQNTMSEQTGWWVYKQLPVWDDLRSYEAGWIAGIIDGEGCLASGPRTSLKLSIAQADGVVLDRIKHDLKALGYDFTVYWAEPEAGRPVAKVTINGGIAQTMQTLGELRPIRLLQKWASFDLWGQKSIQAPKVQVVAVEPAGQQMIQGITTSTGTYIGEGYLHHNTYNNGLNDHFDPKDDSTRTTYRVALGGELHPNNTGRYSGRSGPANEQKYWELHRAAVAHWPQLAIINVKDSVRANAVYPLTDLWALMLADYGYRTVDRLWVPTPGNRNGSNHKARFDGETILVARREH